jgi:hypothetical protein
MGKIPDSHGHDKAVRFKKYGYKMIAECENGPNESVKQSTAVFISQVKKVAENNPAKRTLTKEKHEKDMLNRTAQGNKKYDFRGDKYSVDGMVDTRFSARKVMITGWQMRDLDGTGDRTPVLLSATMVYGKLGILWPYGPDSKIEDGVKYCHNMTNNADSGFCTLRKFIDCGLRIDSLKLLA